MFRLLLSLVLFAISTSALLAQDENTYDAERISQATVFVTQVRSSDLAVTCAGSGTIVRYDGFILTNAHIVVQSSQCSGDTIIISLSVAPDQPPIPRYRAEIVQVNNGLDLALLRISQELDGRVLEADQLPVLPFVEVGATDTLQLDETVTAVGYPEITSSPQVSVPASLSGFIAEPAGDDRSWVKLGAARPLPGAMSGGGVYNRNGQLVGVLTSVPVTVEDAADCQIIEDSNGDGFINTNDICVPVPDIVTVMRPSDFARPLIRSGALQLDIATLTTPTFQANPSGQPDISKSFFAPAISNNQPTTVIGSAPAGTSSLYLFFDYSNMTPETVYEVRVTIDGIPSEQFSLPAVRWSGGVNGLSYIGSANVTWPNGVYEFRIFVNGVATETNSIVIGGAVQPDESFNDIVFGIQDESGEFAGNGYVLPAGPIATARFIYRNMQPGTPWSAIWYYNGIQLQQIDAEWNADDGTDGAYTQLIRPEGGLQPGNYRVELYIRGLLTSMGEFVVAGSQAAALPRVFANIEFSRATSPFQEPSSTRASAYPDGANTLYAYFDWERILTGTLWTMRWRVDGDIVYETTSPWSAPESGDDYTTRLLAPGGLPDGTYTLELLIGENIMASETVVIGIGQLPIDRLAEPGGIRLRGQITDAETGAGIPGATFMLITEDFSIADFTFNAAQTYAVAITDANGSFEIERSLVQDSPYSVMIVAEGYNSKSVDGYMITETILEENGSNTFEIVVPMSKD